VFCLFCFVTSDANADEAAVLGLAPGRYIDFARSGRAILVRGVTMEAVVAFSLARAAKLKPATSAAKHRGNATRQSKINPRLLYVIGDLVRVSRVNGNILEEDASWGNQVLRSQKK